MERRLKRGWEERDRRVESGQRGFGVMLLYITTSITVLA